LERQNLVLPRAGFERRDDAIVQVRVRVLRPVQQAGFFAVLKPPVAMFFRLLLDRRASAADARKRGHVRVAFSDGPIPQPAEMIPEADCRPRPRRLRSISET
jgi:hypothetical protein